MMDAAAMLWVYGFTIYLISLAVEMAFNFDLQDSLFFDFGDSFWFCVLMTLGCFVVAAVKREV